MSSIFTPPGTSARQTELNRQSGDENQLSGLLPGEVGYQQQLQSFRNSQLPNMEQGVQNDYYNTTQGGRNAETTAYGDQQQAAANAAAGLAGSTYAGNPALLAGYKLDTANQANTNTGNYAAQINCPQAQNSAWAQYMNANMASDPNYSGAEGIVNSANGQPAVPVGQGLGSFLGSALGSWAGAGFPSLSSALGSVVGGSTPSSGGFGYGGK